jgi:hypothetical protein
MPFTDSDLETLAYRLGVWVDERFCIEHWVRVDHLPSDSQLAWFAIDLKYRNLRLERFYAESLVSRAEVQEELASVTEQMRLFAERHELPLPQLWIRYQSS